MTVDLDEVVAELRRLNQPVLRPAALPSEADVREMEARAGVAFQPVLRRYFLEVSDVVYGTLEPVTISGAHTRFDAVLQNARDVGVPGDLLPICEDNGDYYCIAASGEVSYWSLNGVTDEKWPDLATWIVEVWIGGR